MALRTVRMPDVGEGTTEAEIVSWQVAVGDTVEEDDTLAEVMTDKATVELPAPVSGKVVALRGAVGDKLPVGSELVVLEVEGEEREPAAVEPAAPALTRPSGTLSRSAGEGNAGGTPAVQDNNPSPAPREREGEGRAVKPLAAPAVRKRASDLGVSLAAMAGSGPEGRITHADLDAHLARSATPGRQAPDADVEAVPVVGLRRAIAAHLEEAHRRIPHFSYVEEVDVGSIEALRAHLNTEHPDRTHLTLLPFLMRAMIRAVAAHPQVNARFDDEAGVLNRYRAVHLGVATQTPNGLTVPVVRHAERLDLWQAAAEVARLAEAARNGKATREELTGSTITISSLGPLGGIAATPIINLPEVAIVGVNKIVDRPVIRDGQIGIARMMNLSSSFDHRIVDGWEAASFIQRVKAYLENPATMFVG